MNTSMTKIDYLANHREFIEEAAQLKYEQWQHTSDALFSERLWEVEVSAKVGELPCTLVALDDEGLLGFVSLLKFDLKAGIHEGVWLLNLYVKAAHRRKGIGSHLIERCITEVRELGFEALYLWTESEYLTEYYSQRGWQFLGKDEDGDDVMSFNS